MKLLLCIFTALLLTVSQAQIYMGSAGLGVPSPTTISSPTTKEYVDDLMDEMKITVLNLTATSGKSGLYNVTTDSLETFEVYCDLDTANGPWMLVMSYANVGANMDVSFSELTGFPSYKRRSLGDSSFGESDWGQATNANIAKFNPTAVRVYCESSNVNRPLHVMYEDSNVLNYLFYNSGTYPAAMKTAFTAFGDHTANLPASNSAVTARTMPLNNHMIYLGGNYHWNIATEGTPLRWECDDYGATDGSDSNTLHYIWIK